MKVATVAPYPYSRFWAVRLGRELLAVTVYKKGALKVAETVNALLAGTNNQQQGESQCDLEHTASRRCWPG